MKISALALGLMLVLAFHLGGLVSLYVCLHTAAPHSDARRPPGPARPPAFAHTGEAIAPRAAHTTADRAAVPPAVAVEEADWGGVEEIATAEGADWGAVEEIATATADRAARPPAVAVEEADWGGVEEIATAEEAAVESVGQPAATQAAEQAAATSKGRADAEAAGGTSAQAAGEATAMGVASKPAGAVLVVGGTDGSGTRKVVQTLAAVGVRMVSEDPGTYDIHADHIGGWPSIVSRIIRETHSADYSFDSLPAEVRETVAESGAAVLDKVKEDSRKTAGVFRVGGLIQREEGRSADAVAYGFKAPIAMTLLPLWDHLLAADRQLKLKFLHVVRDGRDIALSENQGPVQKFYRSMYGNDALSLQVKAIRLWSDWNLQASDYCSEHGVDCHVIHIEALVSEHLNVKFEALHQLARWVGSSLTDKQVCCLAQQANKFEGSHDSRVSGDQPDTVINQRYGKWRRELQHKPRLLKALDQRGEAGLKRFGYQGPGWAQALAAAADRSSPCQLLSHTECPRREPAARQTAQLRRKRRAERRNNKHRRTNVVFDYSEDTDYRCEIREDTDYSGPASKDLGAVPAETVEECCTQCGEDAECRHFTFKEDVCFLKKGRGLVLTGSTAVQGLVSGDITFT